MNNTLRLTMGMPLVAVLLFGSLAGCNKKNEEPPPPPMPAATPAPTPTPAPVVLEVDAGQPDADAATAPAPTAKKGAAADPTGLRACCNALQQNAASMPPPNNAYALQAAAVCKTLVAAGGSMGGAKAQIKALMKSANLPPACQ